MLVYKYNFSEPDQLSEKVIGLIRIMINSLAAHVHICSKYAKTEGVGLAVRSQELSEASNGNGNVGLAGTLQVRVKCFFRIFITKEMHRAAKTTLRSTLAVHRRTRKVHPCPTPRKRPKMW